MAIDRFAVKEFIKESNAIEQEYSDVALKSSLDAWEYLVTWKTIRPATLAHVHYLMMFDLNERIAGTFRNCDVMVGGRVCPSPYRAHALLEKWFEKYGDGHCFDSLSPAKAEEAIKQAHVEYEEIHPFEDGNGRTGRMLLNWHRVMRELPILVIHTGKEQKEYYKWFSNSNTK